MGDDGRLYCKPELPPAYQNVIVPLASLTTPNQFEAELLTGITIKTESDAVKACRVLHEMGPHTVVISSLVLEGAEEVVTIVASTVVEQEGGGAGVMRLQVPRLKQYFTGTGKRFSFSIFIYMNRYRFYIMSSLS